MNPEELNSLNINEAPKQTDLVDNFPKTTKLLEKQLKDKKENIQKVLGNNELRKIFEELLSSDSENRRKCIDELKQCENNEDKIKSIIFANLPEGYVYDVLTGNVVEKQVNKSSDNYAGATVTDNKREQAKTYTEQAKTNTVKKQANINEVNEHTNRMEEAKQYRDDLCKKYQNLDAKTNQNSDNYQNVKTQLENNGTLNQLRQTHDEQFINDYILLQTTLQELKSNPTIYDQNDISYFDKIVKNLENSCNIPDTNLNSFSSKNITRTRHELFNSDIGNQDLINLKESNIKAKNGKVGTENSEYDEMFPDVGDDKLISTYGKFLKGAFKDFCNIKMMGILEICKGNFRLFNFKKSH